LNQTVEYKLNFPCVALFNALFNNEQKVQVSDTTSDAQRSKAYKQKNKNIITFNSHTMKQIIFSFLLFTSAAVMAQSDKYTAAMQKNLAQFDSMKTTADYQSLSGAFERIGDAEKTQWLPYYFAALALTTPGWTDQGIDKDANADKINALCTKAEALAANDADKSEILAVRNMAATQQMMVDPQSRWMSYGQQAGDYLKKAMELNPNNPRLYYLQGMSVFGTPEQFGGGKDKAKPILQKAVDLYKTDQPKTMYPHWGQKQAEDALAQCQ